MTRPSTPHYGWQSSESEHSHAYLVGPVIESLGSLRAEAQLLDIGTGNGALIPTWLRQGWKTSAIEPDPKGYELACRNEEADVRQMTVADPLPQEWTHSFDAVISLEVIEHLIDPIQLVQMAKSALKPGGLFVLTTPYHGYLKNLVLALADKWDFHHHPERAGGHVKFWSPATLVPFVESAGFQFVCFKGCGRAPFLWKSMAICFRATSS